MLRSVALFLAATSAEIGGVFLVWRGLRGDGGPGSAAAGVFALAAYGLLATLQPDVHFGRVLSAYGGFFVVGSIAWAVVLDRFRPDVFDLLGCVVCLAGAALIIWGPRG